MLYLVQIGRQETEENDQLILVKFTSIRKLGIGYDELGQACASFQYRYFV
jgi:hypothetical protein